MKLLVINGTSCSGKSSVVKRIMEEKDNYFHLSYDAIKWQFSKYKSSEKYKDVSVVMEATAEAVIKMNYDIVWDSSQYKETKDRIIQFAHDNNYKIIEVNLEANFDVLLKRFEERVEEVKSNPESKISNTSTERFKELFDSYNEQKNPDTHTIRTDVKNVDSVYAEILQLL